MFQTVALLALAVAGVRAQQVGTLTAENHPALSWQQCSAGGSCTTVAGKIVLDANWRWLHSTTGSTNCYTGNAWDPTLCPDAATCSKNCALDGADYSGTYGITTSGSALTLKFVTGSNVGSRVYLMDTDTSYKLFKVLNREFTFDVNVSNLPCGLNGAVYFSQMDADGGVSRFPNNKAGAKYGTGYCDSQCPRDLKFINGQANNVGWNGTSANSGTGNNGSCCNEMDIWEANSISAAYTPHPCAGAPGQTLCTGAQCGATSTSGRYGGFCDPDGCDFNSYRQGDTTFYGKGLTVDTSQTFTIVTQFITDDGTDTGTLSEIKRFYVQNGKVIPNSVNKLAGIDAVNSITESYCKQQKTAFGDTNEFDAQGGLKTIGQGFETGVVLVLSVWDDYAVSMLWLDSDYPTTASPTAPGVARGTCSTDSGKPADVEKNAGNISVTYSNIKFGPLGSTFNQPTTSSTSSVSGHQTTTSSTSSKPTTTTTKVTTTSTTTSSAPAATQTKYGQCGGNGWTGPTVCAAGSTCKPVSPPYYSQCL